MVTEIFALAFLLTVGNVAHCQDWENLLFIKMEVLIEKQEAALSQLKGMQEKQEQVEGKLQDIQEKQEQVEGKLQEMQEKLQHVETNLQGLHHEMEHLKGTATDSQDSLQRILQEREDLEHFKNISSAGQQELESSIRQEISGVISLLETGGIDECSEGSHNCGDHAVCNDRLFKYHCSCLPGFARDGSHCEDIDECSAQGKAECSPLATCRNSVGSYSCSCNPPFEGDGRTCDVDECTQGRNECSPQATCRNSVGSYSCSCNPPFEGDGRTCEFSCRSPAEVLEGLGCVKLVKEDMTFEEMKATCHQAGGRLLQDFTLASLQEVRRAFGIQGLNWIGMHEGRWLESGLPLQEELWTEGSRGSDPSGRRGLCGTIVWDPSSSSYKVGQRDCSEKDWGLCQLVIPQK